MPRRSKLLFPEVAQWTTVHVAAHPKDFTKALAIRFGVMRAAAASMVRELEESDFLQRSGSSTRPRFSAGPSRWVSQDYGLPDVDESLLWERDFSPFVDLPGNVRNILHHGFTEMVNKASDHSGGKRVHVKFECGLADMCVLSVMDDGIGIFRKIADTLDLPDPRLSLLELSKGKFTSDSSRHSGEGVFFTRGKQGRPAGRYGHHDVHQPVDAADLPRSIRAIHAGRAGRLLVQQDKHPREACRLR